MINNILLLNGFVSKYYDYLSMVLIDIEIHILNFKNNILIQMHSTKTIRETFANFKIDHFSRRFRSIGNSFFFKLLLDSR